MAKKSSIEKNNYRRKLVKAAASKREEIKIKLLNHALSFDDRMKLVHKLAEMPRNSSAVRVRNRCLITGRSRGFYRKFEMSRLAIRDYGGFGLIPGLIKASW